MTSQLTDTTKWPTSALELIGIYVHISTHNKESLTQRCVDPQMYNCVWYICIWIDLSLNWWHALFCITNNRHDVNITTHAMMCHFYMWMTTVRQPTKSRCTCVLTLKYTFICVYWWTRQRIRKTLIMVDRYLLRKGDKTFYAPRFIPHLSQVSIYHNQGLVDSYNVKKRMRP